MLFSCDAQIRGQITLIHLKNISETVAIWSLRLKQLQKRVNESTRCVVAVVDSSPPHPHPQQHPSSRCTPAALFPINPLPTETDVMPWTVVPQRFPFVGWARFRHSGGTEMRSAEIISVFGAVRAFLWL